MFALSNILGLTRNLSRRTNTVLCKIKVTESIWHPADWQLVLWFFLKYYLESVSHKRLHGSSESVFPREICPFSTIATQQTAGRNRAKGLQQPNVQYESVLYDPVPSTTKCTVEPACTRKSKVVRGKNTIAIVWSRVCNSCVHHCRSVRPSAFTKTMQIVFFLSVLTVPLRL